MTSGLFELGEQLLALTPGQLAAYVESIKAPADLEAIEAALSDPDVAWLARRRQWVCDTAGCDGEPHPGWPFRHCRQHQQLPPPAGGWMTWFFQAGRGTGKTRACAEDSAEYLRMHPGCYFALVGRTLKDVRTTMVEGKSGLLSVIPEVCLRGGLRASAWNRGEVTLYLANGAIAQGYTSEKPAQLRGPEHDAGWVDEPATLLDAVKGTNVDPSIDVTWNNLLFGLRSGESNIRVSGTPRRRQLVRDILADPSTVTTTGSSYDNLANLSQQFRDTVLAKYEGTRLARQEIHGHLLEEVEGALWRASNLERDRVSAHPDLVRLVVGVDPPGGRTECGIVAAGADKRRHGYVLADVSGAMPPEEWAKAAILLWRDMECDAIVAEKNYGGDMVSATIRSAAKGLYDEGEISSPLVPVKVVNASRGKVVRAEPISLLSDQHRWHMVGMFPELEDELVTFVEGDPSPNRLDAMVWAGWDTVLGGGGPGRATGTQIANARISVPGPGR